MKKKPLRVLLLEDNEVCLELTVRAFERAGHIALPFNDERKLMQEVEEGLIYDIALMDRSLEGGSNFDIGGDDAMRRLKQLHPTTPIISISCYDDKSPYADTHLVKPCSVKDDAIPLIERCLGLLA